MPIKYLREHGLCGEPVLSSASLSCTHLGSVLGELHWIPSYDSPTTRASPVLGQGLWPTCHLHSIAKLIFMYAYVHASMCRCVQWVWMPQVLVLLEAGVTGHCRMPGWSVGTEPPSSVRAVCSLNPWQTSPAPMCFLVPSFHPTFKECKQQNS